MRNSAFFLHEAVLTLYPAAADGETITGEAVFTGGLANRLRARMEYESMKVQGTGKAYGRTYHIDEEHVLEIDRTWFVRRSDAADFKPTRNQQYVLEMVWQAGGYWYKRTYYGVTGQTVTWDSQDVNQFLTTQVFRAQYFEMDGGPGEPDVFTPITLDAEHNIVFFREAALVPGEYLMGHYRWPVAVRLGQASVEGRASQGSDTVLRLEVNGVLTSFELTLPAAAYGTVVTDTVDLGNLVVPSGQTVRWKILSGPGVENAADSVSITMRAAASADEEPAFFLQERPLVVGEYLQGEYRYDGPAVLTSARVVAIGPSQAPCVLTLEVNGSLTEHTLSIPPTSSGLTEVSNEIVLPQVAVPAGQAVRWKITSGPVPDVSAHHVGLTMWVAR